MTQILFKFVSFIFLISVFYLSYNYYQSDLFRKKVIESRKAYHLFLNQYGMTLKKIDTNDNFKTFIDNSEYFKKNEVEPKFWELIK